MSNAAGGPVHTTAEVVGNRAAGAFRQLTLRVPGLTEPVRPGSFVLTSVPEPRLARRALWVHQVRTQGGHQVIDVIVHGRGVGSHWLAGLPEGGLVPLTGPLGRPFALPRQPVACLLVGESWHASPLNSLAERLAARDCSVTLLLGAEDHTRVLSTQPLRRIAREVLVTTRDGSLGVQGTVSDLLPEVAERIGASVFYASATAATSARVAAEAEARGAWSQVTLDGSFPCGTGLCHGCPVPAVNEGGRVREVRACTEGPVFRGDRVGWPELLGQAPEVTG